MTPPADRPTLRLSTPADLLALVPYLLGFHPASSIVVVSVAGSTVVRVARAALAPTADEVPPMHAALHRTAAMMKAHGATGAILLGSGTAEQAQPGLAAASAALAAASV